MSDRADDWYDRRGEPPATFVAEAAADRFWRDRRRFIATHPDLVGDVAASLFPAPLETVHALTLAASRLPEAERYDFANTFFELRTGDDARPMTPFARLRAAAGIALLVVELTQDPGLQSPRIIDLLTGAHQGDDPTVTPPAAVDDLRKIVARVRLDVELEDEDLPRAAASIAVVEVLDPSSGGVDLQEVFARAAWAAVESWERRRVLSFLLEADRLVTEAAA